MKQFTGIAGKCTKRFNSKTINLVSRKSINLCCLIRYIFRRLKDNSPRCQNNPIIQDFASALNGKNESKSLIFQNNLKWWLHPSAFRFPCKQLQIIYQLTQRIQESGRSFSSLPMPIVPPLWAWSCVDKSSFATNIQFYKLKQSESEKKAM